MKYEKFIAAKEQSVCVTLRTLGLTPSKSIAQLVDSRFQPKGDHRVRWDEFFFQKGLESVERICGTEMCQLRYSPCQPKS